MDQHTAWQRRHITAYGYLERMRPLVCKVCGDSHEGMPTNYGWAMPDELWEIPEAGRSSRAQFNSDCCQLDDRFFIRCVLALPLNEQSGFYAWGVWVEIEESDYLRYGQLYREDARSEPVFVGSIANVIPGYISTRGLAVEVQLQDAKRRPSVRVVNGSHPLTMEQREGISHQRHHEILASIGL